MITVPTTFVVGAGASTAYNLPIGKDLKQRAVKFLEPNADISKLIRLALKQKYRSSFNDDRSNHDRLNRFREELRLHPGDSIDEFLEDRRREEAVVLIGKAVIAGILGLSMEKAREPNPYEDWLRELVVSVMRPGVDGPDGLVEGNSVRFVTFNFDTFIEDRLRTLIHNLYQASPTREFTPVIHIHGKVDMPPIEEPLSRGADLNPLWATWVTQNIERINVTSDTISPEEISEAQRAISSASAVWFLGFSYHPTNVIERLGIPKTLKAGVEVVGSVKGLKEARLDKIREMFRLPADNLKLVDAECRAVFDQVALR